MEEKKPNYLVEIARAQLEKEVIVPGAALSPDNLVRRLASSLNVTKLLLQWHAHHMNYDMPKVYSLEWNLNVKLAVQDMEKLNKVMTKFKHFLSRSNLYTIFCKM
jgi:hypothetical protein